jgi:hypothetical protein
MYTENDSLSLAGCNPDSEALVLAENNLQSIPNFSKYETDIFLLSQVTTLAYNLDTVIVPRVSKFWNGRVGY